MTMRTAPELGADGVETRRAIEEELELFRVLTLVMSEGRDAEASVRGALETICSRTRWSYGELWLRDAQTGAFRLSPVWHGAGSPAEVERYGAFHAASRMAGNTTGEDGLAAQVRASGQAVWVSSVDDLPTRAAAARAAGLEAALAVPALSGGEIEAVAVFLVSAVRPEDQRLMGLVAAAARQLGSLLALRRLEERALRLQRLHRLSAEMSRVLFRSQNRQDILGEACRLAVEADELSTAWIGEVDDGADEVRPVALAGATMDDVDGLPVIMESETTTDGPSRLVARLRTASVCSDVRVDPRVAPWRDRLLARGLLSAASLPIRHRGETSFVVTFYSSIADFFDADEVAVLEGLASEIGFGLDHLASEAARAAAERRMEARTAELVTANEELEARTAQLLASNDELEARTAELVTSNDDLGTRTAELITSNDDLGTRTAELVTSNDDLETRTAELVTSNDDLGARTAQLVTSNRDLEARTAQLVTSNRDLEARTAQLLASNGELEARTAELVTSNDDLEARTAQLLASNGELESRTGELLASNQELESFAYSASHDLRTPLRAINGFSEVLLEEYAPQLDAEGQRYLSRVSLAAVRMGEIIDSLLTLSRLTRTQLREDDVDLGVIAGEIVEDLRMSSPRRVVDVSVTGVLQTRGDRRLLRLLLTNLLDNAWKFTSRLDAAHITVGRTATARGPAFFVRDDGVGFEVTGMSRPFRPFQRLHAAPGLDGLGMGLATVQRVLRLHRGAVWVESQLGAGATFYFQIGPVDAAAPGARGAAGGEDA
jgi:signal transduction histidine kinase